jgi:hypothetical protein
MQRNDFKEFPPLLKASITIAGRAGDGKKKKNMRNLFCQPVLVCFFFFL